MEHGAEIYFMWIIRPEQEEPAPDQIKESKIEDWGQSTQCTSTEE